MVNVPVNAPKTSELPNGKNTKKAACDCGNHEIVIKEEDNLPETTKVGDADDIIADPKFADTNTFTDFLSSAQTDTFMNSKDSSSESTHGNDPQVGQVLLLSPPAPQDNTNSNSDCASKTNVPLTKKQRETIDDKENTDPNINLKFLALQKATTLTPSEDDRTWTAPT